MMGPTAAALTQQIRHEQGLVDSYENQLARYKQQHPSLTGTRLANDTAYKSILHRQREAEDALHNLLNDYLRTQKVLPLSLLTYTRQYQKVKGGFLILVQISLDGVSYSNPAPSVPNKKRIWVKAQIEDAHRGVAGERPVTHDLCRTTWKYPKGYRQQDTVSPGGRDEYFVSFPLVIIREFLAPTSGSTKGAFLLDVDLYHDVGNAAGT